MASWRGDDELFKLIEDELFVAVIGDVLDALGFRFQFLPRAIAPIRADMRILGRALPVLTVDYPGHTLDGQTEFSRMPFGLLFRALDDLKRGEIYVCGGGTSNYALWGELMTLRAMHLGARGAVLDGCHRDTEGVLALDFPTFSRGGYAQDSGSRSRVIDFRIPLEIGAVSLQPGDLIIGDRDGVLAIPRAAEEEAISKALEKARTENLVRVAIEGGMSAEDAFDTYGVL